MGGRELRSAFGARCIARIHAGSLLGHTDLTTDVLAQRRENGFALFFADENGAHGDLGEYTQPLSLLEIIVIIDGVLLVQGPDPTDSSDWRDHYLGDETMDVTVRSAFYKELTRWYEESVREWRAAHGDEGSEC